MAFCAWPAALAALLARCVTEISGCARFGSRGAKSTEVAQRARSARSLSAAALERPFFAELAGPVGRVAVRASFTIGLIDGSCWARVSWHTFNALRLTSGRLMCSEYAELLFGCALCAACSCSAIDASCTSRSALILARFALNARAKTPLGRHCPGCTQRRSNAAGRAEIAGSRRCALGGAGQAGRVGV